MVMEIISGWMEQNFIMTNMTECFKRIIGMEKGLIRHNDGSVYKGDWKDDQKMVKEF